MSALSGASLIPPMCGLSIVPDETEGGGTPALSCPKELASRLEGYVASET